MSKRRVTVFAIFVIVLIGIGLLAGQIVNAKEKGRINKILGVDATVSGTVVDGSGHGWPLYARIDIEGFAGSPVFTDPITGQYTVNLDSTVTYTLNVSAVSGGYVAESREITPPSGNSTEDFSLLVEQATCNAPGYSITGGTLYDFDAGQPGDWTVINNAPSQTVTWRFDDPCGRGNNTGGENGFAIIDSDCDDSDVGTEDAELRSPSFDFSGESSVLVSFDTEFHWFEFSLDEKGDVDVSIDGGASWENVFRFQGQDFEGPLHESIDISEIAGGQSDVMIRFHYYDADFEFWWQVDNVVIGSQCSQVAGGLLVGNVFDQNSGAGVNAATVSSDAAPADSTSSFATPDDPNVDDGFYILFSSLTGSNDFTASKSGYGPDTHTVAVVADAIVQQDFIMGAGIIDPDPDSLEATVELGATDSVTLTLNNTGTADAEFELQEGDGLPTGDLRNGRGAPLIRIPGNYSPLRAALDPNVPKLGKRGIKEKEQNAAGDKKRKADKSKQKNSPLDPPWTAVADYPINIMDNAVVAIDGFVYSVGGFDGGTNLNSGYVYDPAADTWSPIASMTGIREKPVGVAVDGLFYVTGGWDNSGNPDPNLEIYDPSSDSWTTGAPIPTPYAASAGVNLDGQIYVIGGCDIGSCGFTDVQIYDPSADSWSAAADYPEDTSWLSCGAINGLIYCAGGVSDSDGDSAHTFVYDPAGDTWSPLADMPQTQWGAGFVASGGKLYVAGGIGAGSVTNAGFVYDPETDTWSPIENSNQTTYRAGSACGFYRLGGALGFFDPIPDVELYPGLTDCDTVDIPWLSEDPVEGTVPEGGSVPVSVTFDTTVLNQPGDYFAHIKVKENTPTDVPEVGVTLHVPLPEGWGWLEGTVNGLGRCDDPTGPLEGATVFVDTAGVDWPLTTDSNGSYKVAFLASDSPVTVTVSAPNYVGQSLPGVTITAGNTTVQDFTLRLDAPCGDKTPISFDVTLNAGGTATETLTLTNNGAGTLNFEVFETTFDLPPQINAPKLTRNTKKANKSKGEAKPRAAHPRSLFSRPAPAQAALDPNATATWFFGAPIPIGTVRYAHARCDTQPNYFYVISGFDANFDNTDASWRYDAEANLWTELAPFPGAFESPTGVCYQGRIYVMGGFDGNSFEPTDGLYIYDIANDSWSQGATLPRAVWGASAGAWDGKVVLIGGDNFGVTDEVNIYDIASDTWTSTGASMPAAAQLPGYFQTANYVYVVGGWDDNSPTNNVAATQRYDIVTDTWESGPTLNFPRSDFALAVTDTSLYSIGGDEEGGSFFDAVGIVERLDLTTWPSGSWEDTGDPIPVAVSSNNGGFCTEAIHVFGSIGEFWSVGGGDVNGNILGNNAFRPNDEHCFSIFSDVPWLEVTMPTSLTGSVPPDSALALNVNFNAAGLAPGDYTASIVIVTNDAGAPQFTIPVTLHVAAALLNDDFEDGVLDPNWTYTKTWTEAGGVLTLTTNNKKGTAIATPIFAGCQNCGISTSFSTSGGLGNRVVIYGWYVNQSTFIELVLRDDTNKVSIRQRSGGSLVKRQNASLTIDPNTFYTVTMTYDGTNIVVNVDGTDVMTFTLQGALSTGTVGFAVKSGTGSFDFITVN